MSNHTKGEWFVADDAPGDIMVGDLNIATAMHSGVVGERWIIQGPSVPFEEAIANARLIASAPKLLNALKELYALVIG